MVGESSLLKLKGKGPPGEEFTPFSRGGKGLRGKEVTEGMIKEAIACRVKNTMNLLKWKGNRSLIH